MDLDEARTVLRTFVDGGLAVGTRSAVGLVLARLDDIDSRARQVGLKPYATPVEIVDFLLAEPMEMSSEGEPT